MAKCWLRLLAVALVGAGASLASSRADESATFPLSERAFLLGLGPHPAHKKGETPPDLQKALAEALVLAVFRYTEMYAKNGFFLIDRFDKKRIDVFGFTSYPRFASPSDIPADYYRPITERTGSVPIAFTEIGWETKPGDPQSEQRQADFLLRFLRITKQMNLEMVFWTFLHDLEPPGKKAPPSSHSGLFDYYGRPKPAWRIWQKLANLPLAGKAAEAKR